MAELTNQKIEIEQVFSRVWQKTRNLLVVYATEDALNTPREALSTPLERFVRAENKAFQQELSSGGNDVAGERRAGIMEAKSPSKRKHRADSADSMDSNRASMGSDDRYSFEPFEDMEQVAATEMCGVREQQGGVTAGEGGASSASPDGDALGPPLPERTNAAADGLPSREASDDGEVGSRVGNAITGSAAVVHGGASRHVTRSERAG